MPRFLFDLYYGSEELPTTTPFIDLTCEQIQALAPIVAPAGTMSVGCPWPNYRGRLKNGNVTRVNAQTVRLESDEVADLPL